MELVELEPRRADVAQEHARVEGVRLAGRRPLALRAAIGRSLALVLGLLRRRRNAVVRALPLLGRIQAEDPGRRFGGQGQAPFALGEAHALGRALEAPAGIGNDDGDVGLVLADLLDDLVLGDRDLRQPLLVALVLLFVAVERARLLLCRRLEELHEAHAVLRGGKEEVVALAFDVVAVAREIEEHVVAGGDIGEKLFQGLVEGLLVLDLVALELLHLEVEAGPRERRVHVVGVLVGGEKAGKAARLFIVPDADDECVASLGGGCLLGHAFRRSDCPAGKHHTQQPRENCLAYD